MTKPYVHYVRTETAVNVVMTVVMNSIMTFVIFGGLSTIPVWGARGAAVDLVPTSFMSLLMCTIMPGWLTDRRMRAGAVAPLTDRTRRLPGNVALRSLLVTVPGAAVLGLLFAGLLAVSGRSALGFYPLLAFKALLGLAIAIAVSPFAVRESLSACRSKVRRTG